MSFGARLPLSVRTQQRAAKLQAQEEERRVRLERLRSDNVEEVEKIRTDAAESLSKAEQAWETERGKMERELTEKVGRSARPFKDGSFAISAAKRGAHIPREGRLQSVQSRRCKCC